MRNPNAVLIRSRFRPVDQEIREGSTHDSKRVTQRGRWLRQDITVEQLGSTHGSVRWQRIYSAEELDEITREAGFSVLGHYADASGWSFDPEASPHVFTVCAKA